MKNMGRYLDALKGEEGIVANVKFYLRDQEGITTEDVAAEALGAVTMHRNGMTRAQTSYPEPDLETVSLESLF